MTDQHITVPVAKGVEDLIPTYMKNRANEIETLRNALSSGDLEEVNRLGHRMKGVGAPYGFEKVSALGKQIQDGAKAGDRAVLAECIAEYADYIARVRIVYR
jgi:HPt (histidine-containing phosphotransfer) domain-containing protein